MKRFATPLLICSLLGFGAMSLTGCQSSAQIPEKTTNQIQTEVFYLDRSMLPKNSELTVTLEDISKMDVASTVITSKSVIVNSASPYKVVLDYDSSLIQENMRYNIRAQIKNRGKLLYTSSQTNNPFQTNESSLKIKLSKVAPQVKPDVPLTNTYWKVTNLKGEEVITPSGARELFLQLKGDNRVRGFAGCNNFMGNYIAQEFGLRFQRVASTLMMCQGKGNELEVTMQQVLRDTFEYKIRGETLTLFNESREKIAQFKAVYFK